MDPRPATPPWHLAPSNMKSNLRTFLRSAAFCLAVLWTARTVLPAAEPGPARPPEKLPSAREVIDGHLAAIGGREALLQHQSQHAVGQFAMAAQSISGKLDIQSAQPNKIRIQIELPAVGQILTGFNGEVGWSVDPAMGPRLMTGKQLDQLRAEADFRAPLHEDSKYHSMETVRVTPFAGEECYEVKLARKSGETVIEYYSRTSRLLVGSVLEVETPLGALKSTNTFGDYRKFGGILVPTRTAQKIMGLEQVMKIDSVEFDTVPASAFDLPASIQALLGKDK